MRSLLDQIRAFYEAMVWSTEKILTSAHQEKWS